MSTTWIWLAETEPMVNAYADFLTGFSAHANAQASLRISAGSHYAVWLNGQRVVASQYADYPDDKVMDEIDITPLLVPGHNHLSIQAWCQGESSFVYRKGPAALWFEVHVDGQVVARSGSATLCRRSPAYVSGPVEKITPQLSFSFRYDMRAQDDWRSPGYQTGSDWHRAVALPYRPRLSLRPIARLLEEAPAASYMVAQGTYTEADADQPAGDRMQSAALSFLPLCALTGLREAPPQISPEGLTLRAAQPNVFAVVDMEKERAGLLTLDITVPQDCQLLVGFGEHLDDLRVRTSVGRRQFACVVHLKAGRNAFMHPFRRLAGRYLMVMAPTDTLTLHTLSLAETPYPVQPLPALKLPDHLDQRIRDVSIRTLLLCMHEHYEDCPWREQALYAMDSRLQMLSGYYVFKSGAFPRASLQLLAQGQKPSGLLEICAPAEGDITIPSFSLAFILAVQDYLAYTGDEDFVKDMLPVMENILAWFLRLINAEGLIVLPQEKGLWHFYEWQDGLHGYLGQQQQASTSIAAPIQALCVMALTAMADMSGQDIWRTHADILREGLNHFYDADAGAYRTYLTHDDTPLAAHYAELTQSLVMLAGACTPQVARMLREKMRAPDGQLIPTSLAYRFYKYEALLTDPSLLPHVIDDIRQVWGRMLRQGATSFWETERGAWDFDNAGSLCHGWSAIPVYFFAKYVLRIKEPQH